MEYSLEELIKRSGEPRLVEDEELNNLGGYRRVLHVKNVDGVLVGFSGRGFDHEVVLRLLFPHNLPWGVKKVLGIQAMFEWSDSSQRSVEVLASLPN